MSATPLTLSQLQKAQAEAEGFQNGPLPALNPANLFTQANEGNPQPTPPVPTPVPYYPSQETPNLQLSTEDMSSQLANNFVLLDSVFPNGPGAFGVPVVQASLQAINVSTPQTLSITAAKTTLYTASVYLKSLGTGGAGTTYTKTLTYTAADGSGVQTISLVLPLSAPTVVMETYPILALGGTPITTTGVFSGAPSPFTISERLVEMP
jgi:hypothetical protein